MVAEDGRPIACAQQSNHFYHVKSKLHFTCAALQALKRPSVSRLSLQQPPHHTHQVRPQRDMDALTLQPATPLAASFAATSSCQHPSATPRHHLHRPPPPRHHGISLSLPEESPLFLMHLCSGHGGGLPSAPRLLHAIAHTWPCGQHQWRGPKTDAFQK